MLNREGVESGSLSPQDDDHDGCAVCPHEECSRKAIRGNDRARLLDGCVSIPSFVLRRLRFPIDRWRHSGASRLSRFQGSFACGRETENLLFPDLKDPSGWILHGTDVSQDSLLVGFFSEIGESVGESGSK